MPQALGLTLALYQLELAAPTCNPSTQTSEGKRTVDSGSPSLQSKFGAKAWFSTKATGSCICKYTRDMRREGAVSGAEFCKGMTSVALNWKKKKELWRNGSENKSARPCYRIIEKYYCSDGTLYTWSRVNWWIHLFRKMKAVSEQLWAGTSHSRAAEVGW